jgi:hypothetical protein
MIVSTIYFYGRLKHFLFDLINTIMQNIFTGIVLRFSLIQAIEKVQY